MINRVILVGRLTADPVLRKTGTGTAVTSFTIAVNRRAVKGQEQPADFIPCVAWQKTAEIVAQYARKGTQVGVDGRIQTRNYDGQDGKKVYVTEVVVDNFSLLGSKNGTTESRPSMSYEPSEPAYDDFGTPSLDVSSDDLPF
ncbi:MAG: single-stranded DNA-binding protein [Erysipelotrichaceae bacterium]|nr:single-stranded DNA-binding protein [Erysipelotrichaceae bacterium]